MTLVMMDGSCRSKIMKPPLSPPLKARLCRVSTAVQNIQVNADSVSMDLVKGNKTEAIEAESILAIGVVANTEGLLSPASSWPKIADTSRSMPTTSLPSKGFMLRVISLDPMAGSCGDL